MVVLFFVVGFVPPLSIDRKFDLAQVAKNRLSRFTVWSVCSYLALGGPGWGPTLGSLDCPSAVPFASCFRFLFSASPVLAAAPRGVRGLRLLQVQRTLLCFEERDIVNGSVSVSAWHFLSGWFSLLIYVRFRISC